MKTKRLQPGILLVFEKHDHYCMFIKTVAQLNREVKDYLLKGYGVIHPSAWEKECLISGWTLRVLIPSSINMYQRIMKLKKELKDFDNVHSEMASER